MHPKDQAIHNRNIRIIEMFAAGDSIRSISVRLGVTRAGVRAIVGPDRVSARNAEERDDRNRRNAQLMAHIGNGESVASAARQCSVSYSQARRIAQQLRE